MHSFSYPKDLGFLLWSQRKGTVRALVSARTVFSAEIVHRTDIGEIELEINPCSVRYLPVETILSATGFRFAVTQCLPLRRDASLSFWENV